MRPMDRLNIMEQKAKRIKKIQFICNTILANMCYHTKEMESQIAIAEKRGNLTDDERSLILNAWDYRNRIATDLMSDLKDFMEEKDVKEREDRKRTERKSIGK